ncbi:unnamed protein product [Caenorhabditis angaria]|uniref:Uncharacterized protein n=1 Tax=Caenorhabditis angaria TaxID=860376 RepID=A0A9P1I6X7_9PELO|nr:unnamed protein product [Caenorhabditis angaria]
MAFSMRKRKNGTSLDALLKATVSGNSENIDKKLFTTTDRIMRTRLEFVKSHTITTGDMKELEKYTVLKPDIDSEVEAARKLRISGIQPTNRYCRVEPLPPAFFKIKKEFSGSK